MLRNQQVTTGLDKIVGKTGEALGEINTEGMVRVGAEIWHARSDQAIDKGDRIRVTQVSGLLLHIEKEMD